MNNNIIDTAGRLKLIAFNFMIFVFLVRVPGFPFIILSIISITILSLFLIKVKVALNNKLIPLYCFVIYMILRCVIGFVFNGGYEERYFMVLLLMLFVLIVFTVELKDVRLEQCYNGISAAVIVTLLIVLYEIISGNHMSTSRYSDINNEAFLWSVSKPTAFYYNENDMLSFVVCFLPFTFVLKNTMLRVAIFLLAAASAIYIGSKAAIITILIYGLFTKIISKKAILLLVVTGVVLVNLFATSLIENTSSFISGSSERLLGFWDTILSTRGGDESTSERLSIYKANLDWLGNHPLSATFGNGRFGDYESELMKVYGLRMGEFHNLHLEMITIFGLLFYLLFFSYYFYLWICLFLKKNKNTACYPLLISSAMYPLIISFGPSSSLRYPFLFILCLLMILGFRND
ncbi:TPA: O22 family O-antigen polymerase, partial [Escherichia coli]